MIDQLLRCSPLGCLPLMRVSCKVWIDFWRLHGKKTTGCVAQAMDYSKLACTLIMSMIDLCLRRQ